LGNVRPTAPQSNRPLFPTCFGNGFHNSTVQTRLAVSQIFSTNKKTCLEEIRPKFPRGAGFGIKVDPRPGRAFLLPSRFQNPPHFTPLFEPFDPRPRVFFYSPDLTSTVNSLKRQRVWGCFPRVFSLHPPSPAHYIFRPCPRCRSSRALFAHRKLGDLTKRPAFPMLTSPFEFFRVVANGNREQTNKGTSPRP